jgi:hypothetical protein
VSRLVLALALVACTTMPAPAPDAGMPAEGCLTWGDPELLGIFDSTAVAELSGLAPSRGGDFLFASNDSGNPPELFAFSLPDRALAARWTVAGATNVDWEELAPGPCTPGSSEACLFIADVGDNAGRRASVTVYVLAEPRPDTPGPLPVRERIDFTWAGGAVDIEALVVHPVDRTLWAIGKQDPHPVFRLLPGEAVATRVAELGVDPASDGLVTGAALAPDGMRLTVRTYYSLAERRLASGQPFDAIFSAPTLALPPAALAAEQQGEAVAYAADGRALYTSSEVGPGARPPLSRRPCEP